MTRRRRSFGLVLLVTVVFALLLMEGLLLAFVFISPSASDRLGDVKTSITRAWNGTRDGPGIPARVAGAFHRGYEDWIVPLWSEPETAGRGGGFSGCVECHRDYATTRRFSVYMNHPLHAELGVGCDTCHPQTAHPDPPHPQEEVCADCHDEVRERDRCGFCHPPASLPHFYLLGAPRQSVVQCDVCHPRSTFTRTATTPLVHLDGFTGADRSDCLACHQTTSCRGCHGSPHPSDWVGAHDEVAGEDPTACFACHQSDAWCAERCHAVTSTNPPGALPLPTVGVRP